MVTATTNKEDKRINQNYQNANIKEQTALKKETEAMQPNLKALFSK